MNYTIVAILFAIYITGLMINSQLTELNQNVKVIIQQIEKQRELTEFRKPVRKEIML